MTESMGNQMSVGVPVDRHLMDAARRLFADGTWKINQKGARIWHTTEGTFIAWKYASEEILALLAEDNILGIPRSKDTMADILVERGIALKNSVEHPSQPRTYWSLHPEVLDTNKGPIWLQCLKISSWEMISRSEPPVAPIKAYLRGKDGEIHVLGGAQGEKAPFVAYVQSDEAEPQKGGSGEQPSTHEKPDNKQPENESKSAPGAGVRMPSKEQAGHETNRKPEKRPEEAIKGAKPNKPKPKPEPEHTPEPPAQPDFARASEQWLEANGSEGANLLLKMFRDISLNLYGKEELFGEEDGAVYLKHPRAVKLYGSVSEGITALSDAGWLVPNPDNPARKAREMDGGLGLVLNAEVGEHVRNILKGGSSKPELEPVPPSKSTSKPQHKTPEQEPAPAPKPSHPSNSERPPVASQPVSNEAGELLEEFIALVRSGKISSNEKREKDGTTWHVIGPSKLTTFISVEKQSQIPTSMVMNAFRKHPDCIQETTKMFVRKV